MSKIDILALLSRREMATIVEFEPREWYGQAEPSKLASYHKGRLCKIGLLEHDGGTPSSRYRLTKRGRQVRDMLIDASDA